MVKQFLSITLFLFAFASQLHATHVGSAPKNSDGDLLSDDRILVNVAKIQDYTPLMLAVADGELSAIVNLIQKGESLAVKTADEATLFDLAYNNNYGLIGACIQQVIDGNWDRDFLIALLSHLSYCCCGKELMLSPEGISDEQFESYTQALTSCVEMVKNRSN